MKNIHDNGLKLYQVFTGTLSTGESLQDNREGAAMRIASLDMSKIYKALTLVSDNKQRWFIE